MKLHRNNQISYVTGCRHIYKSTCSHANIYIYIIWYYNSWGILINNICESVSSRITSITFKEELQEEYEDIEWAHSQKRSTEKCKISRSCNLKKINQFLSLTASNPTPRWDYFIKIQNCIDLIRKSSLCLSYTSMILHHATHGLMVPYHHRSTGLVTYFLPF